MADNLERSLKGTPAMEDVERMRYENHTSIKGRSQQRSPTRAYRDAWVSINWRTPDSDPEKSLT